MKRLLLVVLFCLLIFYIAWPLLSLWQIQEALQSGEPERLEEKIVFTSVRESMRPAVKQRITDKIEDAKNLTGTMRILTHLIKGPMVDRITSVVLERIVTPVNMIRIANEKGALPQRINRIVTDEIGQMGGNMRVNGPINARKRLARRTLALQGEENAQDQVVASGDFASSSDKPSLPEQDNPPNTHFRLSHIQDITFVGPMAFDISIAKPNGNQSHNVIVRMEFTDMDWKLTQIIPSI